MVGAFIQFAECVSRDSAMTSSKLRALIKWPPRVPRSLEQLQNLEALHEGLDLYLWLRWVVVKLQKCQSSKVSLHVVYFWKTKQFFGISSGICLFSLCTITFQMEIPSLTVNLIHNFRELYTVCDSDI